MPQQIVTLGKHARGIAGEGRQFDKRRRSDCRSTRVRPRLVLGGVKVPQRHERASYVVEVVVGSAFGKLKLLWIFGEPVITSPLGTPMPAHVLFNL
jgi:hypothetical protein